MAQASLPFPIATHRRVFLVCRVPLSARRSHARKRSPAHSSVVVGGIDTKTAEAMVAEHCGIALPRVTEDGTFYGIVDR